MRLLQTSIAVAAMVFLMGGAFTITSRSLAFHAAAAKAAADANLTGMLKIWQEYQLPLPPPDAPLVRFKIPSRYDGDDYLSIGFLIQEFKAPNPAVVLCGYQRIELAPDNVPVVIKSPPDPSAFTNLHLTGREGVSGISSLCGVAVQCQARGWKKFAGYLVEESSPHRKAGAELIHGVIWQHLQEEVLHANSNRRQLAEKMKQLVDGRHDSPQGIGRKLHEALANTTLTATTAPETIIAEVLVERLNHSRILSGVIERDAPLNDPFYDLEAMGFAAVPVLLAHLNDQRPTGMITPGMINMQEDSPVQIRSLVGDFLRQILGDKLRQNLRTQLKRGITGENVVRSLWEQAKAAGEEAWLVEGAPASSNEKKDFPNACHLRLLKSRYPERLGDVLRFQVKHRPKAVIHPIITTVVESSLPSATKVELLKEAAAAHDNPETWRVAMMALSLYDPVFFNLEAVKAFDVMPSDTKVNYWRSPEANLATLALCTDEVKVWAALLRAGQRAEPGLRLELMNPFNSFCRTEKSKPQQLAFLGAFLDDTIGRSLDEQTSAGFCAAYTFPYIRVCDFAAMQIARIMNWPDRPDKTWSERRWDLLRNKASRLVRR